MIHKLSDDKWLIEGGSSTLEEFQKLMEEGKKYYLKEENKIERRNVPSWRDDTLRFTTGEPITEKDFIQFLQEVWITDEEE